MLVTAICEPHGVPGCEECGIPILVGELDLHAIRTKRDQDNAAIAAGTAIRCSRCDMVSRNPNDVREGYCGRCHDWTGHLPDDAG